MTSRLNTPPAPATLTEAVYQTVGAASVCWESMSGTGVFQDHQAREVADDLLDWIKGRLDTETLAQTFKDAWHQADRLGRTGHRTEAGIEAVIAHVLGETDDDPDQATLEFDCG
jgi:hypothetical protein